MGEKYKTTFSKIIGSLIWIYDNMWKNKKVRDQEFFCYTRAIPKLFFFTEDEKQMY